MDIRVLAVDFELLVEPERGQWCDRCLLPSAVMLTGAVTLDGVPQLIRRFLACTDCDVVVDG